MIDPAFPCIKTEEMLNHAVYKHIDGEDDIARINAIQSSFTEGEGGTIQLPSPLYSGTGTIDLQSGVILEGCGAGRRTRGYGTQLITDAVTAISMTGRHSSVRDLNVRSNSLDARVIHIRGGRENLVRDVWVTAEGSEGTGVFIEGGPGYGSYINRLVRVHAAGLNIGVHVYGTITNGVRRANHNSLRECRTDTCDIGVLVEESDFVQLTSHHAEANSSFGLQIIGNSIRTGISHSYFENSGAVDIDASGTSTGGNGWVKIFANRHGSIVDPLNKVTLI